MGPSLLCPLEQTIRTAQELTFSVTSLFFFLENVFVDSSVVIYRMLAMVPRHHVHESSEARFDTRGVPSV